MEGEGYLSRKYARHVRKKTILQWRNGQNTQSNNLQKEKYTRPWHEKMVNLTSNQENANPNKSELFPPILDWQ